MVESFLLNLETQAWIKGLKLIFRFLLKENRIIFFDISIVDEGGCGEWKNLH